MFFIFAPGEMIQFDGAYSIFSNGLVQPPTSYSLVRYMWEEGELCTRDVY